MPEADEEISRVIAYFGLDPGTTFVFETSRMSVIRMGLSTALHMS